MNNIEIEDSLRYARAKLKIKHLNHINSSIFHCNHWQFSIMTYLVKKHQQFKTLKFKKFKIKRLNLVQNSRPAG